MNYEVNILVNGSRCKQYRHDGKLFIEAKEGSEYTIEVKNNTWQRVLAICSVDGLDILTGKPSVATNPGYVLNGFCNGKFEGFRVSNDQVAKFVFGQKHNSYAASKNDGSERNAGVIGIRLFNEKIKPVPPPTVIREEHHHHHHYPKHNQWNDTYYTDNSTTIWNDNLMKGHADCCDDVDHSIETYSTTVRSYNKGIDPVKLSKKVTLCSCSPEPDTLGFDMGTEFGGAKESKVVEVEFERGVLAMELCIYYASRQSLIEMGIPMGNEKMVNYPEPFKDSKYATPPKGWQP